VEEEARYCKRCDTVRPRSEWYSSTWTKPGQWCKPCYREWHRARYVPHSRNAEHRERYQTVQNDDPRDCQWCGKPYKPRTRTRSWFCSRECKEEDRSARDKARRLASKPVDRFCLHCGAPMPQSMRKEAVFCSAKCNESAHRLKRSLRRRTGEGLTGWVRAEVFNRDRWVCGICRKKVDPDLRHPDPMAPSLDHVLPIAEGGTNEPANLRLTHLRCNISRRHYGGNEQLALI
jgi:hypothetical protein